MNRLIEANPFMPGPQMTLGIIARETDGHFSYSQWRTPSGQKFYMRRDINKPLPKGYELTALAGKIADQKNKFKQLPDKEKALEARTFEKSDTSWERSQYHELFASVRAQIKLRKLLK